MFSVFEWKKSELGLVFSVLIFIFGISFYQVKLGEMKTRDAQRKTDVEMVARGLWKYYGDYQVFPMEATGSGKIMACGYMGRETCEWGGGPLVDVEGITYVNKLPNEPLSSKGYRYIYKLAEDGKSFRIYVRLENRSDKYIKPEVTEWCGVGIQCNWYAQ